MEDKRNRRFMFKSHKMDKGEYTFGLGFQINSIYTSGYYPRKFNKEHYIHLNIIKRIIVIGFRTGKEIK